MSRGANECACVELLEAAAEMPEEAVSRALALLAGWAARRLERRLEAQVGKVVPITIVKPVCYDK
jgi:hypothetical protein